MRLREVKSVLRKARKLIATGWVQHIYWQQSMYGQPECFCSIGAINKALGGQPDAIVDIHGPAGQVIRHLMNNDWAQASDVMFFNDHDTQTKAEVLAAFDKAIAA